MKARRFLVSGLGKDGAASFTETKLATPVWFSGVDAKKKVSTWDGTLTCG